MNTRPIRPLLLCACFFAALCSHASATALDSRFGVNGQVAVELGEKGSRANAVLVQPDGKIVAAGSRSGEKDRDFILFRLLPDGSLDPEFNQDGTVTTAVGSFDDEVLTLALQADGKIIAAGYSSSKKNRDFAMVRYNSDGSVDSSFGAAGIVVTAVGSSHDEITDVAVQEDGSILLTGAAQGANGRVAVLARYSADGKPDASFGEEGFTLSVVGVDAQAESVALSKDGRILLSGSYSDGQRRGLMLLGFDSKGHLDKNFGEQGIAVPADSGMFSEGYGMFVQEDGSVLVAGSAGGEGERDAALFRFTAEGKPDSGFEDNGVLVSPAGTEDDVLYDVAVADGTIAAAGFKTVADQREFLLVTYSQDKDGGLTADLLTTGFSSGKDTATALAAAGNSVVAAGESTDEAAPKAAVSMYTVDAAKTGYAQVMVGGTAVDLTDKSLENSSQYVMTGQPEDVTRTSAVISWKVQSGAGEVSQRGIVFSTLPNPTYSGGSSSNGDAPVVTNTSQTSVPSGNSATLSLTTDVDATCKYDTAAGTAYDSMKDSFTTTGAKVHSVIVSSLETGKSYTYYARCKNTASSAVNTADTVISFTVGSGAADTTPPTVTNKTKKLFAESESVTLSASTSEKAICKYNESVDAEYDEMAGEFTVSTDGKSHSANLETMNTDDYTYYVRCKDEAGNKNTSGVKIEFKVTSSADTTPPVITPKTSLSFTAGDTVTLRVETDEAADCKYSKESNSTYSTMTDMTADADGKKHSADLGNSLDVDQYEYYVRCKDEAGNENKSGKKITFEVVAAALTPSSDTLLASSDQLINTALRNVGRFFISTAQAESGCCSYHGGVCGNKCCDGTALSEKCSGVSSSTSSSSFFASNAFAQTTGTTGATGTTGTTTTASSTSSDFVEAGTTKEGSGSGQFVSKLTKLKPGTFFYARAYAVIGGVTYYGNTVGFRTADSCFVATAAFGSVFHPAVQVLRDFRDQFLNRSAAGQALVGLYYRTSPPLADVVSQHDSLRFAVRLLLLPVTGAAWLALHLSAAGLLLPAGAAFLSLLLLTGRRRRTQGRAAIR